MLTLAGAHLSAQSNLVFFTEEGENFILYVNGSKINDDFESRVTATGITSDFAQIKVQFEVEGAPELKQNMMIDQNMLMTSIIKKNKKGRYVFRPVSAVPIENEQIIRIAEVRDIDTVTPQAPNVQAAASTASSSSNSSIGVNISANTTGLNVNVNVSDEFSEAEELPVENYEYNPAPQSSQPAGPDCIKMSLDSFNRASTSIKNKSFSEEKMTVFKQIARTHCMSVSQIKKIMTLFTYEEGKLEVAKLAYRNCTNRENYYQVNDAFTYSESVEELNKFLENQ